MSYIKQQNKDYTDFCKKYKRTLWAVQCRIIKICRERNLEVNKILHHDLITKFDNNNKQRIQKANFEFENKKLQNKLLESLINSNNSNNILNAILDKITQIETRLYNIEKQFSSF